MTQNEGPLVPNGDFDRSISRAAYIFDPVRVHWTRVADAPPGAERYAAGSCQVGEWVLVIGGYYRVMHPTCFATAYWQIAGFHRLSTG